jgi:predicted regulator of Ras-like GTPase activity (Roadblock/LC7/MglB family)
MIFESVHGSVDELIRRLGAVAGAFIGRDGCVRSATLPEGASLEAFGVLCAAAYGASAAAARELGREAPDRLVVEGAEGWTWVVPAGRDALWVVVLDRSVDGERVLAELRSFARGPTLPVTGPDG